MAELVATALWTAGSYAATEAAIFIAANAAAINTIAAITYSVASADRQRRKAIERYNAGLQDRLVMTATTDGPRSRVYGRVRNVDGVVFKATRGTNSEFYTLIIALAGHEIDAVETVYFNDEAVTLDGSGYVTTAPWAKTNKVSKQQTVTLDGSGAYTVTASATVVTGSASASYYASDQDNALTVNVTGGTSIAVTGGPAGGSATVSWQQEETDSKARVRAYLGTAAQDLSVDADLATDFPSLITSGTHKFAGIACLRVDLEFDPDCFPTGVPAISAVIRGAKILDPRTSTTAWTENPALIARDWALYSYGGGCTTDDLVEQSFEDAADACDTATNFTTPSGTTSLDLFTCGIVCKLDSDPWVYFQEMVEAMAGKAGWAGGQLRVVAGVYRASVATITEDWLSGAGDIQVLPEPPIGEAVNVYRATIADKDQKYVAVPAPELRSSTYITADGEELPREIALGGVTDTTHAQHVCGVLMRDARNGLTVVLPCNLRAYQVELFDVVSVTLSRFGWSSKLFEVVDWQFSVSGGVVLTLKETAAAIYTVDSSFAELDLTPNTQLPDPATVATIGTLTVTSGTATLTDGSMLTRTNVAWTAPTDQSIQTGGRIEVQWTQATLGLPTGGWHSMIVAGDATSAVIPALRAGLAYIFRARGLSALGIAGQWSAQTTHIVAKPAASIGVLLIAGNSSTSAVGSQAYRSAGNSDWGAYAYTAESFAGGAIVTATLDVVSDTYTMVQLANDPASGTSWENSRWSAYCNNGNFDIYRGDEHGSGSATVASAVTTLSAGDIIGVSHDGSTVRFLKNGAVVYSIADVYAGELGGRFSFYRPDRILSRIAFAAYGSPSAVSEANPITPSNSLDLIADEAIIPQQLDTSGVQVAIAGTSDTALAVGATGTATAEIDINTNGTISGSAGTVNWYSPTTTNIGSTGGYYVRATRIAGSGQMRYSGSAVASTDWVALTSTRTVSVQNTDALGSGASSEYDIYVLVEIADNSTGVPVIGSGTMYAKARRTNPP